jgi:hypothetical protein
VVLAALAVAPPFGDAATGRQTAAPCTRAAATAAIDPLQSYPYVYTILCGSFSGPGSHAMAAVTGAPPGGNDCLGKLNGWFVFREVGGAWKPVPGGVHYPAPVVWLRRSGDDLLEREMIHNPNGPHCQIDGFRDRSFHWNGSRLAAGNWQAVLPTGTVQNYNFFSPDRKVWCTMSKYGSSINDVSCASKDNKHGAELRHSGFLRLCNATAPTDICTQNWGGTDTPTLSAGQQLNVNDFRCAIEASAVTCAIASGPKRGLGFRVGSSGAATEL